MADVTVAVGLKSHELGSDLRNDTRRGEHSDVTVAVGLESHELGSDLWPMSPFIRPMSPFIRPMSPFGTINRSDESAH